MIHLIPFIAGAAIGAGVMLFAKGDKTKLTQGKKFVEDKAKEGLDALRATKECISEKIASKKDSKPKEEVVEVEQK